MSAIEAMSAGLDIVTSGFGALPETTNGFATIYQHVEDKEEHNKCFCIALNAQFKTIVVQFKHTRGKCNKFSQLRITARGVGHSMDGLSNEWLVSPL